VPVACQIGVASGLWDLPDLGINGSVDGFLYRGANVAAYHFTATLTDVPSPCLSCIQGDLDGFLDDGIGAAPDYVVRGHYFGFFLGGEGRFEAAIFRQNQNVPVGTMSGAFRDHPTGVPSIGQFRGVWRIFD
jgi:hypothetical protein